MIITARDGFLRGIRWEIKSAPTMVGRSLDCDIVIEEATVSRQQCKIWAEGDSIHIENLGTRNPFEVNGKPMQECVLQDGGVFTIGTVTFIVLDRPAEGADTVTLTIADFQRRSTQLDENNDTPLLRTDHVLIFKLCRALANIRTVREVLSEVEQVIHSRFPDAVLWMLRRTDKELALLETESEQPALDYIMPLAWKSLDEERAILIGAQKKWPLSSVMVAPVYSGSTPIGSIILATKNESSPFLHVDLTTLLAIAELVGPFVDSVNRSEQLRGLNERLLQTSGGDSPIVGMSDPMYTLRTNVSKLAKTPLNILITGESGTGKELVAHSLHAFSDRSAEAFIAVNCAAIPSALFESEFFGHVKGAFTGALTAQKGLFSRANRGILFLDEVGELSVENQAKLLRVVETGHFKPLGAQRDSHVDVRIVSATNKNLKSSGFRNDLYHRLAMAEINTVPLRDIPTDISLLANHFLDQIAVHDERLYRTLDKSAIDHLRTQAWIGNGRELRNLLNRVAYVSRNNQLTAEDFLEHELSTHVPDEPRELKTLKEIEREHIQFVLEHCSGSVKDAAEVLGVSRSSLYTKIPE